MPPPLRARLFTPQGRNFTGVTTGGVTHHYVTRGGKLMRESFLSGSTEIIMDFSYDESGRSCCNSGSVVAFAARSPIALLLPLARLP